MRVTVKTKIWITILTVVLMFVFFILFYFPKRQELYLLKNYNKEIQNLANTVALGIKIAITEENFEGVQTAMDFVKKDPHLLYVSMLEKDTLWNDTHSSFKITTSVFKTYPENAAIDTSTNPDHAIIVKKAAFMTPAMNGEIVLGFTTEEIIKSRKDIWTTSIFASLVVFIIGILIGFWLARNISVPVLALRDAANKVGEGDLSQKVVNSSNDEIGELGQAFNKMVNDLRKAKNEVEQRTSELIESKKKTDVLLLNILPAETAEELKTTGSAKAKSYDQVTVMFSDFSDFTKISEKMQPKELVAELNDCFSAFDNITTKYRIEKIKTIGDAYMCVGGLPHESETHAQDVVNAAIEMRNFMHHHNKEKMARGEVPFEMRIGINTGSVVAGIVGIKKFVYDIWGNTVNIASRMESCGEPGQINISGSTRACLEDTYSCIWRGKVKAKGIGEVDMYFVNEPVNLDGNSSTHEKKFS